MKLSETTKKLFDAPWKAYPLDDVGDAEGNQLCSAVDEITAKRIEHLPELYEALKQAVYDCCEDCLCALDEFNDGEYECDENGCVKYDLIEKGCIFKKQG